MFEVKSFVKNCEVVKVTTNGVTKSTIQTNTPCVLISAKDLYRIIHGKDQSVANRVTGFINKLEDVRTLVDYKNILDNEITSIEVDCYCANELEDAAFMTGDHKQSAPVATADHKNAV